MKNSMLVFLLGMTASSAFGAGAAWAETIVVEGRADVKSDYECAVHVNAVGPFHGLGKDACLEKGEKKTAELAEIAAAEDARKQCASRGGRPDTGLKAWLKNTWLDRVETPAPRCRSNELGDIYQLPENMETDILAVQDFITSCRAHAKLSCVVEAHVAEGDAGSKSIKVASNSSEGVARSGAIAAAK